MRGEKTIIVTSRSSGPGRHRGWLGDFLPDVGDWEVENPAGNTDSLVQSSPGSISISLPLPGVSGIYSIGQEIFVVLGPDKPRVAILLQQQQVNVLSRLVIGVPDLLDLLHQCLANKLYEASISPGGCFHRYPRLFHCFTVNIDFCLGSLG